MRGENHFSKMPEIIRVLVDAYLNLHYKKNKKFQKHKYYFLQLLCFSELTFVEPQSSAHHRMRTLQPRALVVVSDLE